MRVIETTVSVLMEVTFPMSMVVPEDKSPAAVCMDYAYRLEHDHAEAKRLIEDRVFDYSSILRVDVRD
jgi:hypothetical protein